MVVPSDPGYLDPAYWGSTVDQFLIDNLYPRLAKTLPHQLRSQYHRFHGLPKGRFTAAHRAAQYKRTRARRMARVSPNAGAS
jgi:hypothetical protein